MSGPTVHPPCTLPCTAAAATAHSPFTPPLPPSHAPSPPSLSRPLFAASPASRLQLDFPALALSYLLVFTIDGHAIMETVRQFPEVYGVIDKVRRRWRVTRAIVREAERRVFTAGGQFRGRLRPLYAKDLAEALNAAAHENDETEGLVMFAPQRSASLRASRTGTALNWLRKSVAAELSASAKHLHLRAAAKRRLKRKKSAMPPMPMVWGARGMPVAPDEEKAQSRHSMLLAAKNIGVEAMKAQMLQDQQTQYAALGQGPRPSGGSSGSRRFEADEARPRLEGPLVERLEAKIEGMQGRLEARMAELEKLLRAALQGGGFARAAAPATEESIWPFQSTRLSNLSA